MNKTKLKEAEERFFIEYPFSFSNPLMLEIAKKHKSRESEQIGPGEFRN